MTDYEKAQLAFTVIGIGGTLFNVWLTGKLKLEIASLKIWAMEKFIEKDDHVAVLRAAIGMDKSQG